MLAAGTLGLAACSSGPTAPGGSGAGGTGEDIVAVEVSCPGSLLIGQGGPCVAVARFRSTASPVFDAAWSSARPDVVAVDGRGVVTGRSAGQTVITAAYRGQQGTTPVSVTEEDALRITAAAEQGEFRAGTTATMWLQGYYSVASAASGRLSLRISDQAGVITRTSPQTVAKGGDFFLLSATFVVPPTSTEVCRTAILEIGSLTIAEPQSDGSELRCIPIRP